MALISTTRDYEILIRFNADGSFAAQTQTLTEIHDGESVVASSVNTPEPLDLAGLRSAISDLKEGDA